jgi:hypothetical protein
VPDLPEVPDVTVFTPPPHKYNTRQWLTTWRAVRFKHDGRWRFGVVKAQVQLTDGRWVHLIEHAADGMHDGWSSMVWAVHDPKLILLLEERHRTGRPGADRARATPSNGAQPGNRHPS